MRNIGIFIVIVLQILVAKADKRFLVIGDWGSGDDVQRDTAAAMDNYAQTNPVDFIVSTGDNIYPWGVNSVDDEQFDTKWRHIYNQTNLKNLTWYLCVGNHDHGELDDGNEWFQVQFHEREPRWHMPGLRYTFTKSVSNTTGIQFFVVDSESIWTEKNNHTEMLSYLNSALQSSSSKWKVVFAHHPCYSAGRYPGMDAIRDHVVPIMDKYRVDAYLTGHDHNLQHLRKNDSVTDYVVTGSGGRRLYEYDTDNHQEISNLGVALVHFSATWGFVSITVSDNSMVFDYIDINGQSVYQFQREKS